MAENTSLRNKNGKAIRKAALIGFTVILLLSVNLFAVFAAEEEQAPAYEKVIAHGGGSYRGYETTNSVEALNNAIANGFRIIELDMELSSDGKIIMLHDWDRTTMHYYGTTFPKKISQGQFTKMAVYGKLEVLTFEKLAVILEKNKDIRIVTDTKGDNLELLTALRKKYPNLTDRFIPQIYDYDQWEKVKELGYGDIIFTLYAMGVPDMEKVAAFVNDHEIYAVAMPDYLAEKGYCRQLSGKGVTVYIHPVSNYEDALQFMKQGSFGVYSGSLLPEEFSGIEKEYYLAVPNRDGSAVKLSDERLDRWSELKLHGLKPGETVSYYIDKSSESADTADFTELKPGNHELRINIMSGKELKGSLTYRLLKDENSLRILHKKYSYRIDTIKHEKDFRTTIGDMNISEEAAEILEHSLIAKEGEDIFYYNGTSDNYMNGEEVLPVQKGSFGKLLLPVSTTLQRLGASSVTMKAGRDITIEFNGVNSRIMANTSLVRRGFQITRLNNRVILYLNKAMAGGEFYQCITGRYYIEKGGIIIILPAGASTGDSLENELMQSAGKLF